MSTSFAHPVFSLSKPLAVGGDFAPATKISALPSPIAAERLSSFYD
ncbi:hypothetical protein [Undibacterium sp.]|nr:hypothetical protein [Undibacterium sp.]